MKPIFVTLLTAINFLVLYLLMPNIPVIGVIALLLVVPGVINCFFFFQEPSKQNLILFPAISTLLYVICGYFLQSSGKIEQFAKLANMNTGNLVVDINTNVLGPDMIIFSFLLQLAILFLLSALTKGKSHARSIQS